MKRSEFIKILTDSIAEGRKQNFPDLRRSEAAVSRISDEARAASLWRKHSAFYRTQTVEQFRAQLGKATQSGS